jgi:AcrR family transcriptional regulator
VGSGERVRREPLSRERVLATAVELIDRFGVHELSMRRIGKALGVEAMALYRYVPSREDLLDGVVERVVDELYADPQVATRPPAAPWVRPPLRSLRWVDSLLAGLMDRGSASATRCTPTARSPCSTMLRNRQW